MAQVAIPTGTWNERAIIPTGVNIRSVFRVTCALLLMKSVWELQCPMKGAPCHHSGTIPLPCSFKP